MKEKKDGERICLEFLEVNNLKEIQSKGLEPLLKKQLRRNLNHLLKDIDDK